MSTSTRPLAAVAALVVLTAALLVAHPEALSALPWSPHVQAARPSLLSDTPAQPLAAPAPAPTGEGGYAVLAVDDDGPVRWDPCRPVRYVVRAPVAPVAAEFLVVDALAELQRVTGLVFVADGATEEAPSHTREPFQPERYGDRWAPVLVSWSDPASDPRLDGDVAGYAGPQAVQGVEPGSQRYVTGQLVLDGPQLDAMVAGPAGLARARAVVLHELAHLAGLDHVDDPRQLMYPSTTPLVVTFSDGDLRGLAAVSGGPCHRDV